MSNKTILILGTGDTKSDEMRFIADCITGQGARCRRARWRPRVRAT